MPEGDTVLWTARRLNTALQGQAFTRTDIRVPRYATTDLRGRESLPVVTYGKHLFHRVEGGVTIHSHLKMEGRWSTLPSPLDTPTARRRAVEAQVRKVERGHTTRALLYTANSLAIATKLGLLEVIATVDEAAVTGHLGPDILSDDWDAELAIRNLMAKPDVPLGEALLDQRNLAGLGTFWISEMLFVQRILPWRSTSDVGADAIWVVLQEARRLMLRGAETGIQSSTGHKLTGETKMVHARSGLPCVRCNDIIRVAMTGPPGRERTLFSCPTCQGGYAPSDDRKPQGVLIERPKRGGTLPPTPGESAG